MEPDSLGSARPGAPLQDNSRLLVADTLAGPDQQMPNVLKSAVSQSAPTTATRLSFENHDLHRSIDHTTEKTISDPAAGQQHHSNQHGPAASLSPPAFFSSITESVNLNLVRNVIAQNALVLILVSVIIIYLAYYFSRISKTCLFGYLQGQTSDHEVPRSKFKRQYLYVNDAQYLASNVDLSQYYDNLSSTKTATLNDKARNNYQHKLVQLDARQLLAKHQQHDQQVHTKSACDSGLNVQLEAPHQQQGIPIDNEQSLLDRNIRLALDNIFKTNKPPQNSEDEADQPRQQQQHLDTHHRRHRLHHLHHHYCNSIDEDDVDQQSSNSSSSSASASPSSSASSTARTRAKKSHHSNQLNHMSSIDCSNSSSADSGVFASASRSHSTASSSSTSSLTIDMSSISGSNKQLQSEKHSANCDCPQLYETDLHQYLDADDKTTIATDIILEQNNNNNRKHNVATKSPPAVAKVQQEFGQCALDWYCDSHANYHKNKLVALISAGMTTGSDKKYVTDTVQTLDKLGYEVCVFIRRGVGGLKLSSTRFFSPSKWRDFEAAIMSVKKQRPDSRLVAIGFSFGSIELCRYLSMSGERSQVEAALLVSCPFDPEAGGRNMRKRVLNRKIDAYLAKNLGKQLYQALSLSSAAPTSQEAAPDVIQAQQQRPQQSFCNLNGSIVDLSLLPKIKSLVDFEDNYNRVIQDYPNSEAYADDSRLSEHLINIKTPTLCLSSEDDFMAPVKLLPIKQIEQNENLCMVLTKRGGHMAFIDGLVWPRKPYFAQRIISKYMMAMRGGETT